MHERAACIAFANHKGGTGKTTSCVSIAGFLARSGYKTLLADFDPQANATSSLGIDSTTLEHSIHDAVLKECGHEGSAIHELLLDSGIPNLHLAPSEFDLSVAEALLLDPPHPFALSNILDPLRHLYDFILIDLPTCSGMLTINGICAAERLVAPLDPGIFSLEAIDNLKRTLQMIREMTGHNVLLDMALLTRYVKPAPFARLRGRTSPCQEIEKALRKMFPTLFVIPESVEIFRCQQEGVPISHFAPYCAAGKAYRAVAEFIVKKGP